MEGVSKPIYNKTYGLNLLLDFNMKNFVAYSAFSWFVIGLLIGWGGYALVAIAGGMWFGNSISAVLTGKIDTLVQRRLHIERSSNPIDFWLATICEFALSIVVIFAILKMRKDAGLALLNPPWFIGEDFIYAMLDFSAY
ncbi:hypothetical protein H0A36_22875 [Endozoicomonas sp. SM1973]|uniref:Uncharacterized protein n=1 Tax=Spartinivicinus marinus TaxID=2994442 RepID=A0A853IHF7_9GAMM|nr:hypothetical protein [Spartinivicinus marinus]MCX4027491.1 hypothetical protein [Spartinivicinus marinus]NYZ68867.1 hypothetical protein [Spartinivicinus marinus]